MKSLTSRGKLDWLVVKSYVYAPAAIRCGDLAGGAADPDLHNEGRAVLLVPRFSSDNSIRLLSNYAIAAGFDFVQRRGNQIYASVRTGSCKTAVDLLFVFDESGSMQAAGYKQCLDFAQTVVESFEIDGSDLTRVASISYGATAHTDFNFGCSYIKNKIKANIKGLHFAQGGSTYTDKALKLAREMYDGTSDDDDEGDDNDRSYNDDRSYDDGGRGRDDDRRRDVGDDDDFFKEDINSNNNSVSISSSGVASRQRRVSCTGRAGPRPAADGVPRVAVVLTDGTSNNAAATAAAAKKLRDSNVNVFAIGLGPLFGSRRARQIGMGIGMGMGGTGGSSSGTGSRGADEIAAIGSAPAEDHVFALKQISDIATIANKMAIETCTEPAALDTGVTVTTEVECGETSYFKPVCKVLTPKMVVDVTDLTGSTSVYVSTTNKNPGQSKPSCTHARTNKNLLESTHWWIASTGAGRSNPISDLSCSSLLPPVSDVPTYLMTSPHSKAPLNMNGGMKVQVLSIWWLPWATPLMCTLESQEPHAIATFLTATLPK